MHVNEVEIKQDPKNFSPLATVVGGRAHTEPMHGQSFYLHVGEDGNQVSVASEWD